MNNSNNKIEVIIFDWAGTTVDFGCFAPVQAFIEAFNEFGIETTIEEVRKPMGMLKKDHIRTMLSMERINNIFIDKYNRSWNEEDVENIYKLSERKILDVVENYSSPKPYVVETINELKTMGIKIGSTTGYTQEMMDIVTKNAREFGYEADCVVTPDSTNNIGRPYPYMIYRNMECLKVSSVNNVIKVGDTIVDIKEGKNAGIISIGVIDGSSEAGISKEEFNLLTDEEKSEIRDNIRKKYLEAGADYVINDIREILTIINS